MTDLIVYVLLLVATLLCVIGVSLDFAISLHKLWWFAFAKISLSILGSYVWVLTLWRIADKDRIYTFGLIWDVVVCCVSYLIPILFFGITLDVKGIIGLILMFAGLMLIKL